MTDPLPLSLLDYVVVLDDAVPRLLSRQLLEAYDDASFEPATIDVDTEADAVRNCDIVRLAEHTPTSRAELAARNAAGTVRSWVAAYNERYPHTGLTGHTNVGLLRYRTGGFYRRHTDGHPDQYRVVTAIGVLHHDHEGGELSLFGGRHVLALDPGQVVLFPATFQYPHEVLEVTAGTRYALISWLY